MLNGGIVREAVGLFHDEKSLRAAADDLMVAGFDRSYLSLLAGQHAIEKVLGHDYRRVDEVADDGAMPRIGYVGSDSRIEAEGLAIGGLFYVGAVAAAGAVVASGGTILAALIAAGLAGGAGGLVGGLLARFIDRHHADYIQRQIDHGAIALWVRTEDAEHEQKAIEIFRRWSADNAHVHELPAPKFDTTGGVSYDLSFMRYLYPAPAAQAAAPQAKPTSLDTFPMD